MTAEPGLPMFQIEHILHIYTFEKLVRYSCVLDSRFGSIVSRRRVTLKWMQAHLQRDTEMRTSEQLSFTRRLKT